MESKTNESFFLKIEKDKYWNIVYSFLTEKTKEQYGSYDNWFEDGNSCTYSYLVDNKIGIRICNNEEELPDDDDDNYFYFHIVDQKKCLWARLKYGI
jgi:hypothetical protein